MRYPERIEIRDDAVLLDGVAFPYYFEDMKSELVEAVDDHHLVLNLRVLFHPKETTVFEDNREEMLSRRREVAAMWLRGFEAAGDPESNRFLVTGDHEFGMAWADGFAAEQEGRSASSNPHIRPGENPDGSPES